MSKGLRHFDKSEVRAVATKRTYRTKEQEKENAPKGLGYWGAFDYLKRSK